MHYRLAQVVRIRSSGFHLVHSAFLALFLLAIVVQLLVQALQRVGLDLQIADHVCLRHDCFVKCGNSVSSELRHVRM